MNQLEANSGAASGLQLPLVSVVMCNYNFGRFIGQAIKSVLGQTYSNFELIVVDDASTDGSAEVIRSFGERVQAIFLERNSGQAEAYNTALRHSRGEIVCLLDSDDYYHPRKLERVVQAFAEHPDWMQISHPWISVDADNGVIGKGVRTFAAGDVRKMLLNWGRYPCAITSGLAYRRAMLEKITPIPSREVIVAGRPYNNGSDCYLVAVAPFYGQVGCIEEPLMYYRIHGNNRRSRSGNFAYALMSYKTVAEFINTMAAKHGFAERFDLERDGDYQAMLALQDGAKRYPAWKMIALTLREGIACRSRPRDLLWRLLYRTICVASPEDGKTVLRIGLRGFFRAKFTSTPFSVGDTPPSSRS
ncbi:glycosyltransferase family 2 protein [Gloeobacter violaceus]|uniref:Gll1794 protein n=1 Tax=Gloeobacter violaceus (strain ATCC 29082 / PCC 7421) TaxID=251221 RepID=Q7NJN8_GLOVI|nr:glycosyltransferase [Gloeobacter violaceus]BAC89735.1 gll1794 [Gloeobacter violaceus PCC 7421]